MLKKKKEQVHTGTVTIQECQGTRFSAEVSPVGVEGLAAVGTKGERALLPRRAPPPARFHVRCSAGALPRPRRAGAPASGHWLFWTHPPGPSATFAHFLQAAVFSL